AEARPVRVQSLFCLGGPNRWVAPHDESVDVSRRSKQHAPDNGPEEKIDDDELAEWIADAGPWADSSHHQAPMIGSTQIIRLSEIGRK
ncbi:MAG: hypothetical protein WB239_01800, partial [Acidimicrobiia bacterium]